jgi:hypothetical protein
VQEQVKERDEDVEHEQEQAHLSIENRIEDRFLCCLCPWWWRAEQPSGGSLLLLRHPHLIL